MGPGWCRCRVEIPMKSLFRGLLSYYYDVGKMVIVISKFRLAAERIDASEGELPRGEVVHVERYSTSVR